MTTRKKILHLCFGNFYIDNYSYQENILTKLHKEMGYEVRIATSLFSYDRNGKGYFISKPSSYYNSDGIKVTRLAFQKPFRWFNKFFRRFDNLESELYSFKPDIIFIHGCQFLDIVKVVKYVKKFAYVSVFVDNHADYINSGTNWLSKNITHKIIWKYCAKKIEPFVEKFYGVTPLRCKYLKEMYGVNEDKIELLLMGSENEVSSKLQRKYRKEIRLKNGIKKHEFLIITGGKIDHRKNILVLMKVISELEYTKIKLIVFGNSSPSLASDIKHYSSFDNINFIGWLDYKETNKYLLAADLGFFPGTHSVLWEQSVGFGLPCVFKKWEGMDHVDLGGNCLLLDTINEKEIRNALKKVLEIKTYREMKKMSLQLGKPQFAYKSIAVKSILKNV